MNILQACIVIAAIWGADDSAIVATVGKHAITEADVQVRLLLARVKGDVSSEARAAVIDDVIDRTLMRDFLANQLKKAPEDLIDQQVARLTDAATTRKLDLAAELQRIGYSAEALRQDLQLQAAWKAYVLQNTSDEELLSLFKKQRSRFDGTTRHVRHLILKTPADGHEEADKADVKTRLQKIRQEIIEGGQSFSDAAREHSESPSSQSGGDLGFIHFRGDLPASVAEAAFATPLNQVSEVTESPFGFHLVVAEEEKLGDLSFADVRADVLEWRGRLLWEETTAELRGKTKIQLTDAPSR